MNEDLVDEIVDQIDDEIDDLTDQLEAGELTAAEWEEAVQDALEDAYLQQAVLGNEGKRPIPPLLWGIITAMLVHQFGYLSRLTRLIARKEVSIGEVRRRMTMYANSSRQAYWAMRDRWARAERMVEERWEAIGDKYTCSPCWDADKMGWQVLGYFGRPGSGVVIKSPATFCRGLTSCRCRKLFR